MINKNKINILLVEDEAIIALGQKTQLEDYNYNVHIVHSGEKAIEYIQQNDIIDLMLMDINLGKGIDGTETAMEILKYKNLPIVFLTSYTSKEIVEKTEKVTSYGYVVKQSGIDVLHASISIALKLFKSS
ncbi:response regulator [Spirochaetota bacterium]